MVRLKKSIGPLPWWTTTPNLESEASQERLSGVGQLQNRRHGEGCLQGRKGQVASGVQLNTSRFRSCVSAAVRSEFPVVAEISP
jgi:hypothetical protein